MKKYFTPLFATMIILQSMNSLAVRAQSPDYEKYGRIAITVIKEDFPGEEVRDYQYMGRKQLSDGQVVDSFQFKVTADGKPLLASVQITHDLKNNRLLNLTVTEQAQQ